MLVEVLTTLTTLEGNLAESTKFANPNTLDSAGLLSRNLSYG